MLRVLVTYFLLLSVACAVPYGDSLSPPRPEVCSAPRGAKPRPIACARIVGTVVDAEGRPVPNAAVFYTVLDRALNPEGILQMTDADARGNFQVNLYLARGPSTSPTATVRLGGSNVSPRAVGKKTPRWVGTSEAVVTYVRVGGTLTLSNATITLDAFVR